MFNLEDFKKYGVALRRDGRRVSFAAHIPGAARSDMRVLVVDEYGELQFNDGGGSFLMSKKQCDEDIVDVVRPMHNVSFSVPEPLSEEPGPGDTVYVLIGGILDPHAVQVIWGAQAPWCRRMVMKLGFVWKTMEEAQAAADVLKKGFRQ